MSVTNMLAIGAVPVLCFALGYLCGVARANKPTTAPTHDDLRKG
jgi:hypothetical protein